MQGQFQDARYRDIPALYDETTGEPKGKNWFYDILIDINLFIDLRILRLEEPPIWIATDEE